MTMPSGFSSKPNKKDLEDHIKLLEEKLELLNSSLSEKVTPYHFHDDQVKTIESIKQLDESIDKKINEIKGKYTHYTLPKGFAKNTEKQIPKKKGLKLKNLLIIIGIMITISIGIISYQPSNDQIEVDYHSEPVEIPSSPYTAPVIESMSAQCQKAYNLGPNKWYMEHCR